MIRFELSTAVTSGYDDKGFLGIQPAAYGTTDGADAGMGPYQQILPLGYYARPLDRGSDKVGAWILTGTEGGKGYAWCVQDPRAASLCPPLTKGSRALVNDSGQIILQDCEADTTTIIVPYLGGSKEHIVTIGKDANGKATIELRHGTGSYVSLTDDGIVARGQGNAQLEVNGDKVNINGNLNCPSAGSFGKATPINTLVTFPGFELFVSTLVSSLGAMTSPTLPPAALATAIGAALTAATATLPTQFLTAL